MKPKTMILLALAITCGLGASYMTSRLLAERQAPEEPEKVDILVAKQNISVHTAIAKPEELFEHKTVTKENEPPDAIHDMEFLRGKKLKTGRNKGDHITPANLYDKGGSVEIPEGYKALGVPVNLQTTASGLASLPGSRVDLQLTIRANNVYDTKVLGLLENVLVLAADADTTREGKMAAPAQNVLFALKPEDVYKVNVAMDMGTIRLVMRNPDDKSSSKVRVFSGRELEKKEAEVAKLETPQPPPPVVVAPPKPDPKPEPEPVKPKFERKYYDIVNGSDSGKRQVDRVYYWRSIEDGRIVDESEVNEAQAGQLPPPPRLQGQGGQKNGNGPREF